MKIEIESGSFAVSVAGYALRWDWWGLTVAKGGEGVGSVTLFEAFRRAGY